MFGRSSKAEVVAGVTECDRLGGMKGSAEVGGEGRKEGEREEGR